MLRDTWAGEWRGSRVRGACEGHCPGVMVGQEGCLWRRAAGSGCLPCPSGALPVTGAGRRAPASSLCRLSPQGSLPDARFLGRWVKIAVFFQRGDSEGPLQRATCSAVWLPINVKEMCLVPEPQKG